MGGILNDRGIECEVYVRVGLIVICGRLNAYSKHFIILQNPSFPGLHQLSSPGLGTATTFVTLYLGLGMGLQLL